jgi:hypothetical protein
MMDYDAYFIFGQDKDYVSPDIPSINHGTQNIFGSIDTDSKSKKKSKDVAESADDEGTAVADNSSAQ